MDRQIDRQQEKYKTDAEISARSKLLHTHVDGVCVKCGHVFNFKRMLSQSGTCAEYIATKQ